MNTDAVVEWVRTAFPYTGPTLSSTFSQGATEQQVACHQVVAGLALFSDPALREASLYRLGIGLNGLARHLEDTGKADEAIHTYKIAYHLLVSAHQRGSQPEPFRKAIGFSFANLKRLGSEPEIAGDAPPIPTAPILDLTTVLAAGQPAQAEALAGAPTPTHPTARRASSATELLAELRKHWIDTTVLGDDPTTLLLAYLRSSLAESGTLHRDLGQLMLHDIEEVGREAGALPTDRDSLQEAAREFRRFAFQAGDDEKERRRRWLLAALVNCVLWKRPGGLPTNEPQVLVDLMGYVGAVLMDRRYNDADRDLLLDCGEAQVRLAHNLAPVVFGRFEFLGDWVLASVGTYLLLAGPAPSSPSDSYYDERIIASSPVAGRALKRAERHDWPELLLSKWQPTADVTPAVSYALASASAWDLNRGRWLLQLIFERSRDEQRELSRSFWMRALEDLLTRVARVRIATNPWRVGGAATGRDSAIAADERGRFIVPDAILRAAAAQGLRVGEIVTVHGKLFGGRRVPTYLLTNRFGPYAIVKLDHGEKVLRERDNFDTFARRLHQSHRPSECHAHPMEMYLEQSGTAVRAIETAYVFEERDEPLTLREWMARSKGGDAAALVKELLLKSLRPWLAHIRRARVDLRAEYPIFRSGPAEGKQAPGNWCGSELAKLESAGVRNDIGVSLLSRAERACPWVSELPGSGALAGTSAAVNPLWFAAEIAELGAGALSAVLDAREVSLRDFDTLLSLCHGDLHMDNVLCASAALGQPHVVIIDFESAHYGHVCKDIARLESSLLCQVFDPDSGLAEAVASWYASSVVGDNVAFDPPAPASGSAPILVIASAARELRRVVAGCGQGHWPIRYDEYLFALLGSLLPMTRYTTLTGGQRRLALLLSTVTAGCLTQRWEAVSG